jgi:hypothetical protein
MLRFDAKMLVFKQMQLLCRRKRDEEVVCYGDLGCFRNTAAAFSAGIFKQSIGARNRVGIGLSNRPARLHAAWRNCFLRIDSWASYKFKNSGSDQQLGTRMDQITNRLQS